MSRAAAVEHESISPSAARSTEVAREQLRALIMVGAVSPRSAKSSTHPTFTWWHAPALSFPLLSTLVRQGLVQSRPYDAILDAFPGRAPKDRADAWWLTEAGEQLALGFIGYRVVTLPEGIFLTTPQRPDEPSQHDSLEIAWRAAAVDHALYRRENGAGATLARLLGEHR